MTEFLWGATSMGCAVVALFMLHFWSRTRQRLFILFSLAFFAFTANWVLLALLSPSDEARHYVYVIRLIGFGLIIAAVVDKNRPGPGG